MASEQIYSTNATFPFDRLAMSSKPISSGGNHIIKFNVGGQPLYVQPPKCTIKPSSGGGASSGGGTTKKHCDFVFSQENDDFLQWIETLETLCQKTLFDNRANWFETSLEMDDIENMFTATTKPYKLGKFCILRATVPYRMGTMSLKVYDENECETSLEQIDENMSVMSILEVQGIKCTSRNFQIEIEVKQILALKPVNLFDRCILKRTAVAEPLASLSVMPLKIQSEPKEPEPKEESNVEPTVESESTVEPTVESESTVETESKVESTVEPTHDPENGSSGELVEVELDLDKLDPEDSVQLKQRNDVYYEMYRDARKKAKDARNLALAAYLEAKRIKNTYMLDEMESDDSDMDFDEDDDA